MILYRVGNCNYINDLTGTGSRLYGGRWNSIGKPMVYLASSRSLAVLEVLAHSSTNTAPLTFCIAEFEVPDNSIFTVGEEFLPTNWRNPSAPKILQQFGDTFLTKKDFLLMKVPSVIVPQEFNFLVNPLHTEASLIKILKSEPFMFDNRLFN
jgi:RES domain-containing protein